MVKTGIKCKLCGDTIVSHHRHDFKYCTCGAVFVDGGSDYLRYGGKDLSNIEIVKVETPDANS